MTASVAQNHLPNECHASADRKLWWFRIRKQPRRKTARMRRFLVWPPALRNIAKLFQILQGFRSSSGHFKEDQENRPATEKVEMRRGNRPAMLFAQAYPRSRGVEEVCGKKWLVCIRGIIRNWKSVTQNGVVIVVRQLANFIRGKSQSADHFCDPLLQFRMRPPLFVGQRRQPLINSQKITLKHGASQRVSNQVLRMLLKELVQQFQGFIVRGTTEQIFGLPPEVRIKFVAPVMTAISGVSHIK